MGDSGQPKRGNPSWKPGELAPGASPYPKGVSGNPRGASRRARLAHLLNQQLNEVVESDPKKRTAGELVMRALIKAAMGGSVKAAELCLDRIDGKLPQHVTNMTPEEAAQTLAEMLGIDANELLGSDEEPPEDDPKEPVE